MARRLLEGSEAVAEAMVAAGCRFFAGYPMTPFTEVLEHMARLLPDHGGVCVNAGAISSKALREAVGPAAERVGGRLRPFGDRISQRDHDRMRAQRG